MIDEEIEAYHQKQIDQSDVKVGDIFYPVENPEDEFEVVRHAILGHGLYFYIVCFEKRVVRLCKNVELYKDSRYSTYFRTKVGARKALITVKLGEIATLEENIEQLKMGQK